MNQYMETDPESFLAYCDWMGIPMQSYPVTYYEAPVPTGGYKLDEHSHAGILGDPGSL